MVRLEVVRADQVAIERHVVAQQRVSDDTLAATEIFARVARLQGSSQETEFKAR